MLRQRLRARTSILVHLADVLLVVFGLALFWYGLMAVLLAVKVEPDVVNQVSGYRDIYEFFAGLDADDITAAARIVIGLAGTALFLLCGWLAWKEVPRPYLARSELQLGDDERGTLQVGPRALERAVELAALRHPSVTAASARFGGDDLALAIDVRRARGLPETLRDVQQRARESLSRHGLPDVPVDVTLTGYERKTRRELQ